MPFFYFTYALPVEYIISPEVVARLEAIEKEAVSLVEKEENSEKALELLNQCIEIESKYPSAYNNR